MKLFYYEKKMERIKVGVLCTEDPFDRRPQSGTTFQIFKALECQENLDVFWIPFNESYLSRAWLNIQKLLSRLLCVAMPNDRSLLYIRLKEKAINKHLLEKADVLFCPFTQIVSIDKPTVYMSDALYHSMINYYWEVDLRSRAVRIGDKIQQLVLDHATKIVLPSQWAIDAALGFYHQPSDKISLVEYGPNIDEESITHHVWHYEGNLHVLFLGIDWERKGGIKAVEACRWLNDNGVKTTLHIVGTRKLEDNIQKLSFIDYVGFLDKNDRNQYERLGKIISLCHCMLLPTKAECAGIAFCESSANGLPSFAYRTGGVPNYVINGENGYLLPLSASGDDFGKKIKECLYNGELERMSKTCLDVYRNILNWNTWGKKTAQILKEVVNNDKDDQLRN